MQKYFVGKRDREKHCGGSVITDHQIYFRTGSRTEKELAVGSKVMVPNGRTLRVAKMMALKAR